MTFDEILNSTAAKIEYLGGLAALAPYIPFPIDAIKEKLDTDKDLFHKDDKRTWDEAAGFFSDNRNICVHRNKTSPIWDLYSSKNITSISYADSVAILKEAARRIAALPQDEIDKLYPNQNRRYYVSITVDGRITIPVLAQNTEDARQIALNEFAHINMGNIECIDYRAVNVEDINGNLTDY